MRRVELATGEVTTVAGSEYAPRHSLTTREREAGLRDGPAEEARFWFPRDVAVAADGTIYVADSHNHAVRAISARSPRVVTTLAGSGACACLDGRGPHAAFRRPQGLHLDERARRLYVAEESAVRVVAVASSADRRAARRLPLVAVRAHIRARAHLRICLRTRRRVSQDDLDDDAAARDAARVREALRFVFVRSDQRPFALVVRFLID